METGASRRLHVGGLPRDVSADELRARMGRGAGGAEHLRVTVLRNDQGESRGFAYVDAPTDEAAAQLTHVFHNTKWRQCRLRVTPAKETFMRRLQREWAQVAEPVNTNHARGFEPCLPPSTEPLRVLHLRRCGAPSSDAGVVSVRPTRAKRTRFVAAAPASLAALTWEAAAGPSPPAGSVGLGAERADAEPHAPGDDAIQLEESPGRDTATAHVEPHALGDDATQPEEVPGLGTAGPAGSEAPNEGPAADDRDLHEELRDESNKSLSILASLFGTPSPGEALPVSDAAEKGPFDPTRATTARAAGPSPAYTFAPMRRFLGGDDEALDADTLQVASTTAEAQGGAEDAGPLAGSTSVAWASLKTIFGVAEEGKPSAPRAGFAKSEDPVTLAGFKASTERATKTQAHSFNFFSAPDPPSHAPPGDQQRPPERAHPHECQLHPPAGLAPATSRPSSARPLPPALVVDLWADYGAMERSAHTLLGGGVPRQLDWQDHRHALLRDAKRKHRITLKASHAQKRRRPALGDEGAAASA